MSKTNSFSKNERIKSRIVIDALFDKKSKGNQSFLVYPIKVIYSFEETASAKLPEVLISVSKRNFKKAVDRNLIKRRIRETYRVNKSELPHAAKIAFIYVGKIVEDFAKIEKAMKKIIANLTTLQ